jgi:hypothetical protein
MYFARPSVSYLVLAKKCVDRIPTPIDFRQSLRFASPESAKPKMKITRPLPGFANPPGFLVVENTCSGIEGKEFFRVVTGRVTCRANHAMNNGSFLARQGKKIMSTIATSPMTQLTFAWDSLESNVAAPVVAVAPASAPLPLPAQADRRRVPLGIAASRETTAPIAGSVPQSRFADSARSNKTEHISDLLLVVLDRYGINPDEFLKGLQ